MAYDLKEDPWKYLISLEVEIRTLTKAGTYYVKDPEEEDESKRRVLNIDREPMEDHLAACRQFALEWGAKKTGFVPP